MTIYRVTRAQFVLLSDISGCFLDVHIITEKNLCGYDTKISWPQFTAAVHSLWIWTKDPQFN